MGRVESKVAIVTGASSGLGKADAWRLAQEGASVVLTDIDESGRELAAEIAASTGSRAEFMQQDVTDEARWKEIVEQVEAEFGGLDILVNNAGIVIVATPEDTSLEQFRLANAVMSEGVFLGCQAAIPAMKRRGGGSIINMSSVASHLGYPVFFAYTAAKGAVRSMTKSIAVHCQMNGYNIRCNSIHAGAIDTPMIHSSFSQMGLEVPDPAASDPADPVGIGRPEDVAALALYLASDASAYTTGSVHMSDGGYLI